MLTAGTYYVAIGDNNAHGQDAMGNRIVSNDPAVGVVDPNGGLVGWETSSDTGTYTILLSQPTAATAAVPEPASLTLLGFGVVGVAGLAWRRRGRRPVA